ncbi:MAG: hypothetical protein P8K79_03390 [Mariniblastus sp.]|nr:hypothetical protein [Mariniblastus sp.]
MVHHSRGLRREWVSQGLSQQEAENRIAGLAEDWQTVELDPVDRAMVNYAVKLTQAPQQIDPTDITRLRQVGLDDLAIHDLCAVTAYFAFANRIADGLGIQLEAE